MLQYSESVRNARLDAVETTIGVAPTLRLYSGSPPNACDYEPTGVLLATFTLPDDWLADASNGAKPLSTSWIGSGVDNGTAGYFRITDSGGTCHMQGSVSEAGGGGDMVLSSASIINGQQLTIDTFTISTGNA